MSKNDFVNIEYEARAFISEEQYDTLLAKYQNSKREKCFITNVNTYFDYEDLSLTKSHVVLRTRSMNDKDYELTLKIKEEKGDSEYNHPLTYNEYQNINEKLALPYSNVKDKLNELGIDLNRLKLIVSLKTERLEVKYKHHLFVIDKNYYRNKVDYNVEVESSSKPLAKKYLNKRCECIGVTYKKGYISKSRRAIFDL